MNDPYILDPDPASRKRIAARRDKWRRAERLRRHMTPEELEEEELRLEAEIQAFVTQHDRLAGL